MNTLRFASLLCAIAWVALIFTAEEYPASVPTTSSKKTFSLKSPGDHTAFLIQRGFKHEQRIKRLEEQADQSQHVPRSPSNKSAGFYKEIKALIRTPQLSFRGLEDTLSARQQETLRLIVKRSNDRNPPALSSGIALYGPPGNGKTRYAEALSDAAGYQICCIKGGFLNRDYAGDGASRVMALAQYAREYASTGIIFFVDEFDVMAKKRGDLGGGSAAANMAATMSMLWGIIPQIHQDYRHVIFIAATNRLEDCDKAMKDRFLNRILFDYPTVEQMDTVRDYHCSKLGSHPTNVTLSRGPIDTERNRCNRSLQYRSANDITWPYQSNPSAGEVSQKISYRDIVFLTRKAGEFAYTAAQATDTQIIITQQDVDKAWERVLENKEQDNMPSEDEKRRQREIENHTMQQESLALQRQAHRNQQEQFDAGHALQMQSHIDQKEQFERNYKIQKDGINLQICAVSSSPSRPLRAQPVLDTSMFTVYQKMSQHPFDKERYDEYM